MVCKHPLSAFLCGGKWAWFEARGQLTGKPCLREVLDVIDVDQVVDRQAHVGLLRH